MGDWGVGEGALGDGDKVTWLGDKLVRGNLGSGIILQNVVDWVNWG